MDFRKHWNNGYLGNPVIFAELSTHFLTFSKKMYQFQKVKVISDVKSNKF